MGQVEVAPSGGPRWDELVDRLAVYDLHYLTGGSAADGLDSPYRSPADVTIGPLLLDLARAPRARLRTALVALLFRHPEHAPVAATIANGLPKGDRAQLVLCGSVLAGASLRRWWRFVLDIYLPGQPAIHAAALAHSLGVPAPDEDYGRPCLAAVAGLLRRDQPFPYAYERDWHDAVAHVLDDLRRQARQEGACPASR